MSTLPERTPLIGSSSRSASLLVMEAEEVARNWAWIMAFGIFHVALGTACLMFPVFASQVAALALTYMVFASACIHLVGACFSDEFSAATLLPAGLVQLTIAILMFLHPYGALYVITFFIAVVYMSAGSYQISVARQSQQMAARGLSILSGVLAVALSIIIIIGLPATSWITIGILIGVNHINIGFCRLIISCYGLRFSQIEGADAQDTPSAAPGGMV